MTQGRDSDVKDREHQSRPETNYGALTSGADVQSRALQGIGAG